MSRKTYWTREIAGLLIIVAGFLVMFSSPESDELYKTFGQAAFGVLICWAGIMTLPQKSAEKQ